MNDHFQTADLSGSWSIAGSMITGRYGHRTIFSQDRFFIIGGPADMPTEQCQLFGSQMVCAQQSPVTDNFHYWPELFNVPADFCK